MATLPSKLSPQLNHEVIRVSIEKLLTNWFSYDKDSCGMRYFPVSREFDNEKINEIPAKGVKALLFSQTSPAYMSEFHNILC